MNKKNIFMYGTCQLRAVAKFLCESAEFNERYNILQSQGKYHQSSEFIRQNINFIDDPSNDAIIKDTDVFIYQPVKDIYQKNSTSYLGTLLKGGCTPISLPFMFNLSTFPVAPVLKRDFLELYTQEGDELALVNKEAIDELVFVGLKTAEILSLFDNNKIDYFFEKRHRLELNLLKNKEAALDIKVSDFIEENINKKQLFLFCSHPTSHLFVHVANQILAILGLSPLTGEYPLDFYGLTSCGFPITYPSSSTDYFKFEFTTREGNLTADAFYRRHIVNYLKSCNIG